MPLNREQISLITDITGAAGITADVDQTGGADAWSITVDQTWLQSYLDANVSATPLTTADEARVAALEALVGVTTVASGSSGAVTSKYVTMTGTPSTAVGLTWNIVTGDGLTIISKTVSVADGASAATVLRSIARSIETSSSAMKYIDTVSYSSANSRVDFAFTSANPTHTLTFTSVTGTGISFSVTQ
jgi:hypothetical protein